MMMSATATVQMTHQPIQSCVRSTVGRRPGRPSNSCVNVRHLPRPMAHDPSARPPGKQPLGRGQAPGNGARRHNVRSRVSLVAQRATFLAVRPGVTRARVAGSSGPPKLEPESVAHQVSRSHHHLAALRLLICCVER